MRVIALVIGQQPNHPQGFKNAFASRFWLEIGIQTQRKIEDLRNTLTRVERCRRILEDHADTLAAERVIAEFQRMVIYQHFAAGGFNHACQHLRQRGFTGTVLTDDRQRLFFAQGKAERLHGFNGLTMEQSGTVAKGLTQVTDFQ